MISPRRKKLDFEKSLPGILVETSKMRIKSIIIMMYWILNKD